jgi:hypothetical protein
MKSRWLVLVALGFLFASVFTSLSTGAERRGYDQEQHAPIGRFQVHDTDGNVVGQVMIQRGRFSCSEGQRRAFLLVLKGGMWIGCATDNGREVRVRFEDGDELVAAKDVGT